jgi:hypothetical protein
MPLWVAGLLLILCVLLSVLAFRAYRHVGRKIFLAAGIILALVCAVALLYAAATLIFISSVN